MTLKWSFLEVTLKWSFLEVTLKWSFLGVTLNWSFLDVTLKSNPLIKMFPHGKIVQSVTDTCELSFLSSFVLSFFMIKSSEALTFSLIIKT